MPRTAEATQSEAPLRARFAGVVLVILRLYSGADRFGLLYTVLLPSR